MSNTNTPPRLYALTPIDQTEGLEDGKYVFSDMFGEIRNAVLIEFNNGVWQSFTSYTHYLRPLPEGTRVLSEEELGELVEKRLTEMMKSDPVKLLSYMIVRAGIMMEEANANEMRLKNDFSAKEQRYQIEALFTLTKLAQMGE